jgi:hypothetical protein
MILGISATQKVVVVAETTGRDDTFSITQITSVPFQAESGEDLAELLRRLVVLFGRHRRSRPVVALLGSSSGRYKAALEAIKAEAITELAAVQSGLQVTKVTPSSLKSALGCANGQKWPKRAAQLFHPRDEHEPWSRGSAGAASAAFKVARDSVKSLDRAGSSNRLRRPTRGPGR